MSHTKTVSNGDLYTAQNDDFIIFAGSNGDSFSLRTNAETTTITIYNNNIIWEKDSEENFTLSDIGDYGVMQTLDEQSVLEIMNKNPFVFHFSFIGKKCGYTPLYENLQEEVKNILRDTYDSFFYSPYFKSGYTFPNFFYKKINNKNWDNYNYDYKTWLLSKIIADQGTICYNMIHDEPKIEDYLHYENSSSSSEEASSSSSSSSSSVSAPSGEVYYISPTGGGSGMSVASPCLWGDLFWHDRVQPGDIINMLPGDYSQTYGFHPSSTEQGGTPVNGTSSLHITIQAYIDGTVNIVGDPVSGRAFNMNSNKWIDVIGINCHSGNPPFLMESCSDITIKRVCAWDSKVDWSSWVFELTYCNNILLEDCAGWGTGKKIFQSYYCDTITYRRCFGRWEGSTSLTGPKSTFAIAYNSTNVICENCIGTWDAQNLGQADHSDPTWEAIFTTGSNDFMLGNDFHIRFLGCISFILPGQNLGNQWSHNSTFMFNGTQNGVLFSQCFSYCGHPSEMYGVVLWPMATNALSFRDKTPSINQIVEPIPINHHIYQTYIINGKCGVTDPIWNTPTGSLTLDGDVVWIESGPTLGNMTECILLRSTKDYIYNAAQGGDWNVSSTKRDADMPGQTFAQMITVNPFSALALRVVDGTITPTSLWPWPMNARILSTMTRNPIDVTATVMALQALP